MTGFGVIKDEVPSRGPLPQPFDLEVATRLYNVLKSHKLLYRSRVAPSIKQWAGEIRLLRNTVPEHEITSTLEWYCQHIRDEYVPRATTAKRFRESFDRIQDAMRRVSKVEPETVDVGPVAVKLQHDLLLDWPAGERKWEGQFLQLSLDAYARVERALLQLMKEEHELAWDRYDERKGFRSADWRDYNLYKLLSDHLPSGPEYIAEFARRINGVAWTWSKWDSKKLLNWSFTMDRDKHFETMIARRISEYTGSGDLFDKVWARLKGKVK